MVDLHCPVICFTEDASELLIVKRADNREYYPGKWEFGCAKPKGIEPLWKEIQQEYQNDFGVPIYLSSNAMCYDQKGFPDSWGLVPFANISSMDTAKNDEYTFIGSPVVISSYEMKKSDGTIAIGIIFEGSILNVDIDKIKLTDKHSEYKFITLEEAFEMTRDEVVPTFHLPLSWYVNGG